MSPAKIRFHHLGVACRSLETESVALRGLGYAPDGEEFVDGLQGIRGRFHTGPGPRLELLVALPGSDTLSPWLSAGVKLYHQAFEVEGLLERMEALVGDGGRIVAPPTPAVAFGGRDVCFVMMRNLMLIELIEQPSLGKTESTRST